MAEDEPRDLSGLVRSWQHKNEVHAYGCPSTKYYAGACTEVCIQIVELLEPFTPEEIASLPISGHEDAVNSASSYG